MLPTRVALALSARRTLLLTFASVAATLSAAPRMLEAQAAPRASAATVVVQRWYLPSSDWHLYSADAGERPAGWTAEGARMQLFPSGTPGTKPLYRFRRTDGGHILTSDAGEVAALRGYGWVQEAVLGHVATTAGSGLVALHRWVKPGNQRHFYSVEQQEGTNAGFRYEGVVGYVARGDGRQAAAAGPSLTVKGSALLTNYGTCASYGTQELVTQPCTTASNLFYQQGGTIRRRLDDGREQCLDGAAGKGQAVRFAACNGARTQEWWYHGHYAQLQNQSNVMCLDIEREQRAPGARLILWECKDTGRPVVQRAPNQKFALGLVLPASFLGTGASLATTGAELLLRNNGSIAQTPGMNVIATGGGNVISTGGLNVISTGGGNVIATGGGNVISTGGGNVISTGGGNIAVIGAGFANVR